MISCNLDYELKNKCNVGTQMPKQVHKKAMPKQVHNGYKQPQKHHAYKFHDSSIKIPCVVKLLCFKRKGTENSILLNYFMSVPFSQYPPHLLSKS